MIVTESIIFELLYQLSLLNKQTRGWWVYNIRRSISFVTGGLYTTSYRLSKQTKKCTLLTTLVYA